MISEPLTAFPKQRCERLCLQVGFSPTHARRACLATSLAGVPQVLVFVCGLCAATLHDVVLQAFRGLPVYVG